MLSSQYVPSTYRPRWRNERGLKREREREERKEKDETRERVGEKFIRGGEEKGREGKGRERRLGGASLIIAIKPRR